MESMDRQPRPTAGRAGVGGDRRAPKTMTTRKMRWNAWIRIAFDEGFRPTDVIIRESLV
jgi:hypothetical protein